MTFSYQENENQISCDITSKPWSNTKMWSMATTVEMRWAIVTVVLLLHSLTIAFRSLEAVWVSTFAVHSSKQSTWNVF